MKKNTLEYKLSKMNEFEKFVYFSSRLRDLEELIKLNSILCRYARISDQKFYPRIKKEFGINGDQYYAYYSGKVPLPESFLYRFRVIFKAELRLAQANRDKESQESFWNFLKEPILPELSRQKAPIPSPQKATA